MIQRGKSSNNVYHSIAFPNWSRTFRCLLTKYCYRLLSNSIIPICVLFLFVCLRQTTLMTTTQEWHINKIHFI